jgi:hypothetical protein
MTSSRKVNYTTPPTGLQTGMPYLPLTLSREYRSVDVSALVDSGSTLNVLPYHIGIQLGLDWQSQTFPLPSLVGNLKGLQAFGVLLDCVILPFPSVKLAFAWTSSDQVPILLGQTNFFTQFDVCFFGSQNTFEISPKKE